MGPRLIRRATAFALVAVLASVAVASADTIPADGDQVAPGNQTTIDLGQAGPGATVSHDVTFALTCDGLTHALPDETIAIDFLTATVPLDGDASATSTSIGPVPPTWTPNGLGCPSPAPRLPSASPSSVTLKMPTTPGLDYVFSLMYSRAGSDGLTKMTLIDFKIDVVPNSPPTLVKPGSMSVEGNTTGGATVAYTVSAVDAEDDPDPTPTCAPASGSFFPLGPTTVACSVTDSGGLKTSGTFNVTVRDTKVPTLVGMPAGLSLTTSDPAGAALAYARPTAADIVDSSPVVTCDPAPGAIAPVGSSSVTCAATDASGNAISASFPVKVAFDPGITWTADWMSPIGGSSASIVSNGARTIPVKVRVFANGVPQSRGDAELRVASCDGGAAVSVPLDSDGDGRWSGHLDTSQLAGPGCYVGAVALNGHVAGSFRLDVRGADVLKPATRTVTVKRNGPKG